MRNRNYRMFRKRYAEMDLYQEIQRSHDRVKVMLNETIDERPEVNLTPPSAQENLQRFIQQHETTPFHNEVEKLEQNFINLETETLPENQLNYNNSPINNTSPSSVPENNIDQDNYNNYPTQSTEPQLNYDSSENAPPQNYEKKTNPAHRKKVEDELDDIIRDALNNIGPYTSTVQSDVDPELLKMLKKLLLKNHMPSSWDDNNFFQDVAEPGYGGTFDQNNENLSTNKDSSTGDLYSNSQLDLNSQIQNKPEITPFDQQLQNQQSPPKIPVKPSTVKRPEVKHQVGVFDPSFTTMDFDDDSSLALTKKEISNQVKNLIRETLEENTQEATKPNDLLELEKQLKEHIEKIKHSRKINYEDE